MHKTLFTISTALFSFLGIFFSAATVAHAETVTLPLQFEYAGLTFNDESITYTSATKQSPLTVHISFTIPEKIQITHLETNKVMGEVVLLPTIATVMTLPVLPDQQPPAVFKNEDGTEIVSPTPSTKPQVTQTPQITNATPTTAPTTAPLPSTAASIAPQSNAGGLDPEKLFAMSNAYRASQGLPAFQKDERACSLAASRAPEIAAEVTGGYMHAGLKARALPYWNSENIISMRTEEAAFNWWINDKIHHDAIVGNYAYSCVACSGNSCAQEFTNFQPK